MSLVRGRSGTVDGAFCDVDGGNDDEDEVEDEAEDAGEDEDEECEFECAGSGMPLSMPGC